MALTTILARTRVGANVIIDTDAITTPVSDVDYGPTDVHAIAVTNGNGSAVYLMLYDSGKPVFASSEPDFIFQVPANSTQVIHFTDAVRFDALSYVCSTAFGTGQGSNPASDVTVHFFTEPV